jgi:hypothetical protein
VRRLGRAVAALLEQRRHEPPEHRIVVDDETSAPPGGPRSDRAAATRRIRTGSAALSPPRQIGRLKYIRVPLPCLALDADHATHQLDQAARDCEAETGAPYRRVVLPSACMNFSKMTPWRSFGIPMPVSTISNIQCPPPRSSSARTVIEPSS